MSGRIEADLHFEKVGERAALCCAVKIVVLTPGQVWVSYSVSPGLLEGQRLACFPGRGKTILAQVLASRDLGGLVLTALPRTANPVDLVPPFPNSFKQDDGPVHISLDGSQNRQGLQIVSGIRRIDRPNFWPQDRGAARQHLLKLPGRGGKLPGG